MLTLHFCAAQSVTQLTTSCQGFQSAFLDKAVGTCLLQCRHIVKGTNMPDRRLNILLGRIRRRVLLVGGTAGVLWGFVAAACVWGFGVWLDLIWELSPLLRITTTIC